MKLVNIRDQAKFDRAQWLLKVLVPCWMVQISLYMILVGMSGYLLSNATRDEAEERGTAIAWEVITIAVAVISLFCTAYEVFKTVAEALTPRDMMISSIIKITGTILSIIMTSVMSGTTMWKWSIGTQIAHGLSIISILILASYGAWKWRVLAQYDDYHHPANVKPFGFKSDLKNKALHSRNLSEDWDVERQADWPPAGGVNDNENDNDGDNDNENAPLGNTVNISSSPEATPADGSTRTRGSSFVKMGGRLDFSLNRDVGEVNGQSGSGSHSRNNSASALMSVDTSYEPLTQIPRSANTPTPEPRSPPPVAASAASPPTSITGRQRSASYISVTGTGTGRKASYNHTRDTSFDEYVQQRRVRKDSEGKTKTQHKSQGSNGSNNSNSNSASSRSSLGSVAPRLLINTHTPTTPHSRNQSSSSLKDDVDQAIGAEFGWGNASRTSSQESVMGGGTPPAIAVAGGSVAGVRSVRNSLGRAPSDESEAGVLGSVPERREDEVEVGDGGALLGGGEGDDGGVGMSLYRDVEVGGGSGRARGMSETIEFVVTPPPRTSSEERRDLRRTWGAAYAALS